MSTKSRKLIKLRDILDEREGSDEGEYDSSADEESEYEKGEYEVDEPAVLPRRLEELLQNPECRWAREKACGWLEDECNGVLSEKMYMLVHMLLFAPECHIVPLESSHKGKCDVCGATKTLSRQITVGSNEKGRRCATLYAGCDCGIMIEKVRRLAKWFADLFLIREYDTMCREEKLELAIECNDRVCDLHETVNAVGRKYKKRDWGVE